MLSIGGNFYQNTPTSKKGSALKGPASTPAIGVSAVASSSPVFNNSMIDMSEVLMSSHWHQVDNSEIMLRILNLCAGRSFSIIKIGWMMKERSGLPKKRKS